MDFFDSQGKKIVLGKELGQGGEGAVFDVQGRGSNLVAKIYHGNVSQDRQAKLRAMTARKTEALGNIAAWPIDTVHTSVNGSVHGFLMAKAVDAQPLHHLYGPGHRKQQFPKADWSFLLSAARNVASAFTVVHASGSVIGDVNPNLVFVSRDSTVRLIDCDSFQFVDSGRTFACEVGVPTFTPPELQGLLSFRNVNRTSNHDNFGLALLVFHLLLMGRHPFAGVYRGAGDMSLEQAIKEFRYAFASPGGGTAMYPPPNTVGTDILPNDTAAMFEKAFGRSGEKHDARPSAGEWMSTLDRARAQIQTCTFDTSHKYYRGRSACPWCELERSAGVAFFFSLGAAGFQAAARGSGFDVARVWSDIMAVRSPGIAAKPDVKRPQSLKATPLPADARNARFLKRTRRVLAVVGVVFGLVKFPAFWFFILIAGALLFYAGGAPSPEQTRRKTLLETANRVLAAAWSQWNMVATDKAFHDKLEEFKRARQEYDDLSNRFSNDKSKLQANIRELQMRNFLEKFFLSDHDIPGIGPTRKTTLASFGVETAADVEWNKIHSIKGFGERLTKELVQWRRSLEKRFVFDPSKGVDPADMAVLQQRYALIRKQLEALLVSGPAQLRRVVAETERQRVLLQDMLVNAETQVAQAELDFAVSK
ncbi:MULTISPECIES: helix-hairpin-helix domain-containing protein [Burkholderiaceae]|uniref:Protein kinase domain-containing protein n=1 Tax=Caballeronia zhejiangensis TaxID=871203 RepID=A0A656QEG6_9BURK|nr:MULTISPECIES: hypothetical protein [Burkholderiaceae]KAK43926.1 hypothetical protein BG58_28640 [Caballeronia jiangsuensis]KDR28779.1 hypothetical protein BG60_09105 [Caballeronia zhejiangensis]KWU19241.1 hypothetical protein AS149_13465 [Burkholderia cenocepacia]SAL57953.1 hypothetical protein AWB71_03168 [Caballeronia peredens]